MAMDGDAGSGRPDRLVRLWPGLADCEALNLLRKRTSWCAATGIPLPTHSGRTDLCPSSRR
jgi:hypothetical protein